MEYDFIVVGAGSAGCVLANRLSASHTVLLLEAGGSDHRPEVRIPAAFSKLFKTDADWDFSSGPEPGADSRHLFVPRGRLLGGSSSMNAMIYIRGRPHDYETWVEMGAEGWGWDEVLEAFTAVEDNERGPGPFHGVGGELRVEDQRSPSAFTRRFVEAAMEVGLPANEDFNGASQDGVGLFQVTQRRGRRWSSADAFLHPVRHRPTLTVETSALAARVVMKGARAVGVTYLVDGEVKTARVRGEVVLAAGAIGSPALLQRSGIGPPEHLRAVGIDPIVDLPQVGENLQDHPVIMSVYRTTPGTLEDAESLRSLTRYLTRRSGMLTSNVGEGGAFVRTHRRSRAPDIQFHFGPAYYADHGLSHFEGNAITLGPCLVTPASKGHVRVRNGDPRSHPHIVGNHLTAPEDIPPLLEGLELAEEILNASPFDDVRAERILPEPEVTDRDGLLAHLRRRVEALYDPAGTCRIGPPGVGVVDPRLRVHGTTGIRVADASVMPVVTGGNTNAPTIMIGTRAARMIVEDG